MSMADEKKIPLIAIIGPTAVGKTALSLSLARALKGEIVSVDSRQVYRYMDVGTDKVSREVCREIPHHLINVADPDQPFSAADFVRGAQDAISRIHARGFVPILAGGTPFYFHAFERESLCEELPSDWGLRERLEKLPKVELARRLEDVDPESARRVHPNDGVRLLRALEIFELTGRTATQWYTEQAARSGVRASRYAIFYIGLTQPYEILYERIERRVREQFESGYAEEVKWLLDRGYDPRLPALQGFGYRELVRYHEGTMTYEEALAGDVRSTKAYARRQRTWFTKFEHVRWFDVSQCGGAEALVSELVPMCECHLAGEE